MRRDEDGAGRMGYEAASFAEGDDDDGRPEFAAERMEIVIGKQAQRGLGKVFASGGGQEIYQSGELGFVGDEHIDILQDCRIKIRAHGRGVEDGCDAGGACGFQYERSGGEVGFKLGDDDFCSGEKLGIEICFGEVGVGAECDDDLVLTGGIDKDAGGAGRLPGLFHEAGGDVLGGVEGLGFSREGVASDRADEERGRARASRRHGLVGALAAGARGEVADDGFTRLGEGGAPPHQILHKAANDDDLGFHGCMLRFFWKAASRGLAQDL